jgi:hypothetical protein
MESGSSTQIIPDWLQQVLALILTIAAAVLYAVILGGAIVRTFVEPKPVFSEALVRAAGLLSGMVGSVVAAGFARARRPMAAPVIAPHPMGGRAVTSWTTLKAPSRARVKLQSLGELLGFWGKSRRPARPIDRETGSPTPAQPTPAEPVPAQGTPLALWVGVLYFAVYFLVGIGAFAVIVLRPVVPDLIANSAWVWLGTVVASGYSFFGLNSQG